MSPRELLTNNLLQTEQQSSFASQIIGNSLVIAQTAPEKDFKKTEMLTRGYAKCLTNVQ